MEKTTNLTHFHYSTLIEKMKLHSTLPFPCNASRETLDELHIT